MWSDKLPVVSLIQYIIQPKIQIKFLWNIFSTRIEKKPSGKDNALI